VLTKGGEQRVTTTSRRDIILIVVAVGALAAAGIIYGVTGVAGSKESEDFPEGHAFICLDCKHVTILSSAELFEFKAKARESGSLEPARVVCSACGSDNTFPAVKCPRCGEYSVRTGSRHPVCPHCKQPFPSLFDD
jgi:hypothetical protein